MLILMWVSVLMLILMLILVIETMNINIEVYKISQESCRGGYRQAPVDRLYIDHLRPSLFKRSPTARSNARLASLQLARGRCRSRVGAIRSSQPAGRGRASERTSEEANNHAGRHCAISEVGKRSIRGSRCQGSHGSESQSASRPKTMPMQSGGWGSLGCSPLVCSQGPCDPETWRRKTNGASERERPETVLSRHEGNETKRSMGNWERNEMVGEQR